MVDSINSAANTLIRTQGAAAVGLKTTQRTVQASFDELSKAQTVSVTSTPLASTATPGKAAQNLPRGSLVDVTV